MHAVTVISLLGFLGQARAKELEANGDEHNFLGKSTDNVVDDLLDRTLEAWTLTGRPAAVAPQATTPALMGRLPQVARPVVKASGGRRDPELATHSGTPFISHLENPNRKKTYVIDATGQRVGRLATQIVQIAMGKHTPYYQQNQNVGSKVIVTNCQKVTMSGNKMNRNTGKRYFFHSRHLGSERWEYAANILEGPYPERVLKYALKGMFPQNRLGKEQLKKNVRLFAGEAPPELLKSR